MKEGARSAILLFAGRVASGAIGLVTMGVATRTLGPAGFGRFEFALSFVGYFLLAADPGVRQVLIRRLSAAGGDAARWFGAGLGLRLLLAVAALPLPVLAARGMGLPADLTLAVGIASLLLFPSALDTGGVLLQAHRRFGRFSLAGVLQGLAALALALYGARAGWGASAWLGGALGSATIGGAILVGLSASILPPRPRWDPAAWREILREGWPIGLSFGIFALTWRIDMLLLERGTGSIETVGRYGLAYRFVDLGAALSGILVATRLPVFSRLHRESSTAFRISVAASTRVAGAIALGLSVLFFLGGEILARLAGGPAFAEAGSLLRILGWVFPFYFLEAMWGTALIAARRARGNAGVNFAGLILNVALNLAWIPRWGAAGAALATVASQAVESVGFYLLYRRLR